VGKKIKNPKGFLGALILSAPFFFGCGEASSPTAPSLGPGPVGPVLVYAPTPRGLSPAVWRVGFLDDGLCRPEGAVYYLPPPQVEGAKTVLETVLAEIEFLLNHKESLVVSATPPSGGVVVRVLVTPGLTRSGAPWNGGLTQVEADGNRLDGGPCVIGGATIQFSRPEILLHDRNLVMHEIFRSLGVGGTLEPPASGLMSLPAWPNPGPNPEEHRMLLERYNYPSGALWAP